MNVRPASPRAPSGRERAASAGLYAAFALAVFTAQGSQPLLGGDHLTYFRLADDIRAACPGGDYWREANSVRSYGVLLAYLHGLTGSHVLSMKLVLAVFTVLYLLAAERFFALFAARRGHAVLFALLSAFAVSFGIASWGVTDSTALLPRTLVAPFVMLAAWAWFRFDGRPAKYLVFPVLVVASTLHLSAFYLIGVLLLVEAADFALLRRCRVDRQVAALAGALALSAATLLALEFAGVSSRVIGIQVPELLRSFGLPVRNLEVGRTARCEPPRAPAVPAPAVAAPAPMASGAAPVATLPPPVSAPRPLTAQEAWALELSLRPWRNMPLPWVNVANALSSFALILALALAGIATAVRRGLAREDRLMLLFLLCVPAFALGPQTLLWILRSFTSIYPATIEEVRALGLLMIPSLYFVLVLFRALAERGAVVACAAVAAGVVALPLVMKNLPIAAREGLLGIAMATGAVDRANPPAVANARSALGIAAETAPLYYATEGVRAWLAASTPPGARILTDRDDLLLLRGREVVGTRQIEAITYYATPEQARIFQQAARAIRERDGARVIELAREAGASYAVVPWRAAGAAYADDRFSVLAIAPAARSAP